ncbi:hypothetical protein EJ02DRAFT_426732 [Clathrospora elynae]|uniref:Uncharacterized protein n=1 Tax=Clathrospora elynae TaxID=706981 RepID=A0A6A5SCR0_9PLEO|nr:hypothetical protein EJ02DRAFT_426732 [Clathrospora elynae]
MKGFLPLGKRLGMTYSPHSKHLTEHNGALTYKEDPALHIQIAGCSCARIDVAAANAAHTLKRERAIQAQMHEDGSSSPKKKGCHGFVGLVLNNQSKAVAIQSEAEFQRTLNDLVAQRNASSSSAK